MNTEARGVLCTSVHTHTTFCDGADTPAAMAAAAAEMGLQTLGFSGHGYVPQENFGIPPERMGDYCEEIRRLREMYAGRLEILCGLELDTQTPPSQREEAARLDYRIGSCHAVQDAAGRFWTVDDTPQLFERAIREGFGGDALALARAYYQQFVPWVRALRPEIVGHLDLVTKFNEGGRFFDEEDPRYRALALGALDALLEDDPVLEVNTGAVSRGWRRLPLSGAVSAAADKGGGRPGDGHRRRPLRRRADLWVCGGARPAAGGRLWVGLGTDSGRMDRAGDLKRSKKEGADR